MYSLIFNKYLLTNLAQDELENLTINYHLIALNFQSMLTVCRDFLVALTVKNCPPCGITTLVKDS